MKKDKKATKENKPGTQQGVSPCDDLFLLLLAARSRENKAKEERNRLQAELDENKALLREIQEQEEQKRKQKRSNALFAAKLLGLFLLSFGSTLAAVACLRYAQWWTAIAPFAILAGTIVLACKKP